MSSRPWVRIPPAQLQPGGVAQTGRALACQARRRRFESGRPRFSRGGRGVTAAPGVVNPAVSVRARPAAPSLTASRCPASAGVPRLPPADHADAEHLASSPRCNRDASRCGGSTPPVRIHQTRSHGDVAQPGRAPRLQRGRCRFDSDRLHLASVVSTASTRPLYGRGAGSTPAGGSSHTHARRGEALASPARRDGQLRVRLKPSPHPVSYPRT